MSLETEVECLRNIHRYTFISTEKFTLSPISRTITMRNIIENIYLIMTKSLKLFFSKLCFCNLFVQSVISLQIL